MIKQCLNNGREKSGLICEKISICGHCGKNKSSSSGEGKLSLKRAKKEKLLLKGLLFMYEQDNDRSDMYEEKKSYIAIKGRNALLSSTVKKFYDLSLLKWCKGYHW